VFHVPAGRFMAVGRNVTTGFFALPTICLAPDCNSRTDPADTKPGRYKPPDQLLAFLESL
jgi:hypothetical protein